MRFTVSLPEARELTVDYELPAVDITAVSLDDVPLAETVQAIAHKAALAVAEQIEPYLPAASPARKVVERDESGQSVGLVDQPAVPSPTLTIGQVTAALVPVLAAQYRPALASELERLRPR